MKPKTPGAEQQTQQEQVFQNSLLCYPTADPMRVLLLLLSVYAVGIILSSKAGSAAAA
jgi:hypothetical protein